MKWGESVSELQNVLWIKVVIKECGSNGNFLVFAHVISTSRTLSLLLLCKCSRRCIYSCKCCALHSSRAPLTQPTKWSAHIPSLEGLSQPGQSSGLCILGTLKGVSRGASDSHLLKRPCSLYGCYSKCSPKSYIEDLVARWWALRTDWIISILTWSVD